MGRITKKELQEELKKRDDVIRWQFDKIQELQKQNEEILDNKDSVSKEEYEALSKLFKSLQEDYQELKKLYEHEKEKKHNARGAGRKSSLTDEQIEKVRELHQQGLSYGTIAKEVGISKSYVYKLINKQNNHNAKLMTEEEYNNYREHINTLRKGLRDEGYGNSKTEDLPPYEEYIKNRQSKDY